MFIMKLKDPKQLCQDDISIAWDRTQELYDIYKNSEDVEELIINSKLVDGALTLARSGVLAVDEAFTIIKKQTIQKNIFIGTTLMLSSYIVLDKIVKRKKEKHL